MASEMKITLPTAQPENCVQALALLGVYNMIFKAQLNAEDKDILLTVPFIVNNASDYRLCEMAFQINGNYNQKPLDDGNLHFIPT